MKKALITLSVLVVLASCGKDNKVNTAAISSALEVQADFQGTYNLTRSSSNECSYTLRIVQDCNGYRIFSDGRGAEEFCNINQDQNRNAHPFDNSAIVTRSGNRIDSTVNVGPRSFTNTIILENNNTLTKISNLKSRESRCVYERRNVQ